MTAPADAAVSRADQVARRKCVGWVIDRERPRLTAMRAMVPQASMDAAACRLLPVAKRYKPATAAVNAPIIERDAGSLIWFPVESTPNPRASSDSAVAIDRSRPPARSGTISGTKSRTPLHWWPRADCDSRISRHDVASRGRNDQATEPATARLPARAGRSRINALHSITAAIVVPTAISATIVRPLRTP